MTPEERAQFIADVAAAIKAAEPAAIGKEPWDAQGHGTPDRIDALVTVIGGVLMLGWLHLTPLITGIF